ncbi:MAG: helix-turn-helix transcriptional regulator [Oscillospiraceae bacterium]|nr:helix-turn-helix transcriptional regulator [Oscillospiraceae bacterium]
MDLVRIGSFLAELRREKGMTQEKLGEILGVSNKTVSRWENGNYLPPVEMLQAISTYYGVSINEILSGQRLTAEEYQQKAEENLKSAVTARSAVTASPFSLNEKIEFYKGKWKKDHYWTCLVVRLLIGSLICIGIFTKNVLWSIAYLVASVLYYGWERNEMMKYVEDRAFDGSGR